MSDSRERFEAWKRTVPPVHREEIEGMFAAWQAAERDALERAAKELHGRLMWGDMELGEAYLRLKVIGVPPTEAEFLSFIRALAGKE